MRGCDLRLRPLERDAIVAVIDAGDHVVSGDMLVVSDGDGGEVVRHFRGKRGLPCRDKGIVRGLEMSSVVRVEIAAAQGRGEKHSPDGGDNGAAMQHAVAVLLADWRRLSSFRLRGCGLLGGRTFLSQGNPCLLFPGHTVRLVK